MMNCLQKNQKLLMLLLGLSFLSFSTLAQSSSVSGTITSSSDGQGLPGVNVVVKGTTEGTITDLDGAYSIEVESGATLVFSSIGFETQEIPVGSRSTIDISLVEDVQQLGEVVVVGYGTQKKSDLTGAISSVKGDEIRKFSSNSPVDALQGQMAGVNIIKGSGGPTANTRITIRGLRSVNGTNPLVIVDGLQGDINAINPDDIESVEVLKDAAAASIYGSLAANGVIIITTKSGESGEPQLEFSSYFGVDKIQNTLDFANASEYTQIVQAVASNGGRTEPDFINQNWAANTNWMDEMFSDAAFSNYNITVKGGSEKTKYMLSGSYNKREGILLDEQRDKKQVRTKLGTTIGRLSLDANIFYSQMDDDFFTGNINNGYEIMPIVPVLDSSKEYGYGYISDDDYGDQPDHENPIGENAYKDATRRIKNLVTNFSATVDIIDGLKATGRIGIDNRDTDNYTRFRPHQVANKRQTRFHYLEESTNHELNRNIEGFLNYDKSFGDHTIGVMVGASRQDIEEDWMSTSVEGKRILDDGTEEPIGFNEEDFNTFDAGAGGIFNASGSGYEVTRMSQYGRLNYSFMDRYFVQASVRRDGSSRFGANNRYGTFPSAAMGWKISNESFFNVEAISFLKLKASWGKLGSEAALGAYDFAVFTSGPYRYPFGVSETQGFGRTFRAFPNPTLQWEAATTINVGVNFGLFADRLVGEFNYYKRNTEDMIIPQVLPASSGFWDPFVNAGDAVNKGIELELTYRKNTGDFQYSISGNISHNTNEITKVVSEGDEYFGGPTTLDGTSANVSKLGYPIGAFFVYQADGIFQDQTEVDAHTGTDADGNSVVVQPDAAPGDMRFTDVNGDGVLNNEDLVYAGSGMPKFNFGLNFTADYKGLDFTVSLYGASGHKLYNAVRQNYEGFDNYRNHLSTGVNAWTPSNTNTDIPRAVYGDPNQNASRNSTRFIESGNYVRVRNIQLGYTIPSLLTDKIGVSKVRVYVSGQNLFTFTNYSGIDPEISTSYSNYEDSSNANAALNIGTDFATYPNIKTMLVGLQVNF
ncbi:MAG: TonB-dependent receptor [Reichenbachiella sp.]|uniref:SusC/RagA family TonB-linked outer membrane protein n=1 Tax=Reichenbachiella sp. TaxID=2184521 RepID=UPI0032980704